MKLLILIILTSATWITAIVQWFQHDDHTALGFLILSLFFGNWASGEISQTMNKRYQGLI